MILGNIYAPLTNVITVSNIYENDLFFPEVISTAKSGIVSIHRGDEFILHSPDDAITLIEVLDIKEYVYSANINSRMIKTLSFTASTKSTSTHPQNCTVIDPFPIYQIYVSGEFMCIALSGDVSKLQTNDGMKQYHISEKYDTISYLGELYYLCKGLSSKKRIPGNNGQGSNHYPVYHLLILSKKRPFNMKDYQLFVDNLSNIIK